MSDKTVFDCFSEGEAARIHDLPRDQNPYPEGSRLHKAWDDGWQKAADPEDARTKGYD